MAGAELIKCIQEASESAARNREPADVVFGEVVTPNPLSVRIDEKRALPQQFFVVPDYLKDYTGTAVMNLFKRGDKVVMIKAQGGQMFLIIGRI